MKRSLLFASVLILMGAMLGFEAKPTRSPAWTVAALPYRVLVEVEPVDLGGRRGDSLPASVDLDFTPQRLAALGVEGRVDLDSIQVFRFDPAGGAVMKFCKPPGTLGLLGFAHMLLRCLVIVASR